MQVTFEQFENEFKTVNNSDFQDYNRWRRAGIPEPVMDLHGAWSDVMDLRIPGSIVPYSDADLYTILDAPFTTDHRAACICLDYECSDWADVIARVESDRDLTNVLPNPWSIGSAAALQSVLDAITDAIDRSQHTAAQWLERFDAALRDGKSHFITLHEPQLAEQVGPPHWFRLNHDWAFRGLEAFFEQVRWPNAIRREVMYALARAMDLHLQESDALPLTSVQLRWHATGPQRIGLWAIRKAGDDYCEVIEWDDYYVRMDPINTRSPHILSDLPPSPSPIA